MEALTMLTRAFVPGFLFALIASSSSVSAQTATCPPLLDFTLDDHNRPTRLEMAEPNTCVRETVLFSYSPVQPHTFPYNAQTFLTEDGLILAQIFRRDYELDHTFTYILGSQRLVIAVDRVPFKQAVPAEPPQYRLLPARISIQFGGRSASFVFTGQESEQVLSVRLGEFFAVGRMAADAGFDSANLRMGAYTKRFWDLFSLREPERSILPFKATFPATELTTNVFALSFVLQNDAFYKSGLCSTPKNLGESLFMLAGVKKNLPENYDVSMGTLCCLLCEVTHCLFDIHNADPICCFGTCCDPEKACCTGHCPPDVNVACEADRSAKPAVREGNAAPALGRRPETGPEVKPKWRRKDLS